MQKEKWPDNWYSPHGLARAFSALGDYKKALKLEKEALLLVPKGSKVYVENYVKAFGIAALILIKSVVTTPESVFISNKWRYIKDKIISDMIYVKSEKSF